MTFKVPIKLNAQCLEWPKPIDDQLLEGPVPGDGNIRFLNYIKIKIQGRVCASYSVYIINRMST